MFDKDKRWPIIVIAVLVITICVNIAFGWVAIRDESGGFELVREEVEDASYRLKVPLEDKN